jgi:MFS family permease
MKGLSGTFSSLRIRNYRLYFIGQAISVSGTFMQSIAQAWLVLQLTNSGTALGITLALQYLPMLFLSPWGGVIADRFSKRKLLYMTQAAAGILALILGILVLTGTADIWMVYLLALGYGITFAIDNPVRQSFVSEMVGDDELKNAVTLYSTNVNLARVIGPVIAGVLIAKAGLTLCFLLNALSYVAVIIALFMMHADELYPAKPVPRKKGQLHEGLRYVRSKPALFNTLVMVAIIGTLTYEFQVSLPLLAQFTFNGDAETYAILNAAFGIGAVAGGLVAATSRRASIRMFVCTAALFGLTTLATAFAPSMEVAIAALVFVGVSSIFFTTLANTTLQLGSAPEMRGRVMAFWSIAFIGSTAIGGPVIGWVGEYAGPRWGLAVGGLVAVIAAAWGAWAFRKAHSRQKK